jgi:hypothetical protein
LISAETEGDLTEMRSHLPQNQIKQLHRAEPIHLIMAQLARSRRWKAQRLSSPMI